MEVKYVIKNVQDEHDGEEYETLYRQVPGQPDVEVYQDDDGMCPEDKYLRRDLSVFVEELQWLAAKLDGRGTELTRRNKCN